MKGTIENNGFQMVQVFSDNHSSMTALDTGVDHKKFI